MGILCVGNCESEPSSHMVLMPFAKLYRTLILTDLSEKDGALQNLQTQENPLESSLLALSRTFVQTWMTDT